MVPRDRDTTPGEAVSGHRGRLALGLLAVALLVGSGVWLILAGLTPGRIEDAPLPAPFVVAKADPSASAERPPAAIAADRLRIPSIGVDAPLVAGGITAGSDGRSLTIPSDPAKLTISTSGAPVCDKEGTTLVAGHVASYGVHGALWPLSTIAPTAVAYATCADGTVTAWRAVSVEVPHKADIPQDIFSATGERRLVVVTCGGPVMPDGHYRDNVVVTFVPVRLSA